MAHSLGNHLVGLLWRDALDEVRTAAPQLMMVVDAVLLLGIAIDAVEVGAEPPTGRVVREDDVDVVRNINMSMFHQPGHFQPERQGHVAVRVVLPHEVVLDSDRLGDEGTPGSLVLGNGRVVQPHRTVASSPQAKLPNHFRIGGPSLDVLLPDLFHLFRVLQIREERCFLPLSFEVVVEVEPAHTKGLDVVLCDDQSPLGGLVDGVSFGRIEDVVEAGGDDHVHPQTQGGFDNLVRDVRVHDPGVVLVVVVSPALEGLPPG